MQSEPIEKYCDKQVFILTSQQLDDIVLKGLPHTFKTGIVTIHIHWDTGGVNHVRGAECVVSRLDR